MKRTPMCRVCGWTEAESTNGSEWANAKRTLCTHCALLTPTERRAHREHSITHLESYHTHLADQSRDVAARIKMLQAEAKR